MTNDERWLANYEALKTHVTVTGHFPISMTNDLSNSLWSPTEVHNGANFAPNYTENNKYRLSASYKFVI